MPRNGLIELRALSLGPADRGPAAQAADDLQIGTQAFYTWHRQVTHLVLAMARRYCAPGLAA